MKRIFAMLMAGILLLGLLPAAGAESGKKVTIMVYMCGADLERDNLQGTNNIKSISAAVSTETMNTVALLGGTTIWGGGYDPQKLTLLELGGRRPKAVDSFDSQSMGQAETLTFFLDLCRDRYPADRYILVMWDHGGGPNGGVCYDMLYDDDCLTVNELAKALGSSGFADQGLDLIAFNTCLTGAAEYAANLAPFARYMVATEDSMYGLNFAALKTADADASVLDTAEKLVDATFEMNQEIIEKQRAKEINAVSAFDLSKMDAVVRAMDDFFPAVTPKLASKDFPDVSRGRGETATFGSTTSNGTSNYDLADLGDLVRHLRDYAPEKAEALLDAIDAAVVHHRSSNPATTGMTVYHPYSNKAALMRLMAAHNDIPLSEGFSAYIQEYAAKMMDRPLADFSNLHADPAVSKDTRTRFTLALTADQAAHVASSRFQVLYEQADGSWRMIFDSPDAFLVDEQISGEYNGSALAALENGEGGEAVSPLITYERGADDKILIPATLTRTGKDELPDLTANGLIVCTEGENRKLIPGAVLLWDKATEGYTGIAALSFGDFTEVTLPIVSRTATRYEEPDTLRPFSEWEVASEETWTKPIDGSWSFGFLMDTLKPEELAATFQVTDVQYDIYSSELYRLKPVSNNGTIYVNYDDLNLALVNEFKVADLNDSLMISAKLTNLTEQEVILQIADLTVNQTLAFPGTEVYGSGEVYWGLKPGETQTAQIVLKKSDLAGQEALTSITFNLNLLDATDETVVVGTVPVEVTLMMTLQ